jgi:hypothetical protein
MMFTYLMEQEDMCREWFEWFKQKKVPAAIIRFGKNYAVFRRGRILRRFHDKTVEIECPNTPLSETLLAGAEIIDSCHGY